MRPSIYRVYMGKMCLRSLSYLVCLSSHTPGSHERELENAGALILVDKPPLEMLRARCFQNSQLGCFRKVIMYIYYIFHYTFNGIWDSTPNETHSFSLCVHVYLYTYIHSHSKYEQHRYCLPPVQVRNWEKWG